MEIHWVANSIWYNSDTCESPHPEKFRGEQIELFNPGPHEVENALIIHLLLLLIVVHSKLLNLHHTLKAVIIHLLVQSYADTPTVQSPPRRCSSPSPYSLSPRDVLRAGKQCMVSVTLRTSPAAQKRSDRFWLLEGLLRVREATCSFPGFLKTLWGAALLPLIKMEDSAWRWGVFYQPSLPGFEGHLPPWPRYTTASLPRSDKLTEKNLRAVMILNSSFLNQQMSAWWKEHWTTMFSPTS